MTEIKADVDFVKMAEDIAQIRQILLGNGEPGLCKRVSKIENGIPKTVAFFSAFGVAVGSFITFLFQLIKG